MKRFWGIFAVVAVAGLLIVLAGCSKDNNSNPASSNETDQSALSALMTEDTDLEGVDSWNGDDESGPSPLDSAISPIKWFRIGVRHRDSVTVEISGDSIATITRYASFNGVLHMLIDTAGGVRDTLNKPMQNSLVRKAHARRVAHGRRPHDNWRIYEVTPEVLTSTGPGSNTVHPVRVQFYVNDDATPVLDVQDPLNTYFSRDSLPLVPRGAILRVVVTPSLTDTVAAYLHPHVWREGRFHRLVMTPGDNNTYSASFAVGQGVGVRLTAPDLFNRATLFTSDGAYDAGSWAIPYRVVAP